MQTNRWSKEQTDKHSIAKEVRKESYIYFTSIFKSRTSYKVGINRLARGKDFIDN